MENDALRREYMQAYHACISFIDAQLAVVIDSLKEQGLWENTVIILTSDHGYHLGDHFLWGKVTLFDIGARVPFLVRVPGMTKAGSTSDAMVELIDVFPTLADIANLDAPSDLQGTSLVSLLRDPTAKGAREYAYSVVTRRDSLGYALRNQSWRYTKWPVGEELYDLREDPSERNNLARNKDMQKTLQRFRSLLSTKQKAAASHRHANARPEK